MQSCTAHVVITHLCAYALFACLLVGRGEEEARVRRSTFAFSAIGNEGIRFPTAETKSPPQLIYDITLP